MSATLSLESLCGEKPEHTSAVIFGAHQFIKPLLLLLRDPARVRGTQQLLHRHREYSLISRPPVTYLRPIDDRALRTLCQSLVSLSLEFTRATLLINRAFRTESDF